MRSGRRRHHPSRVSPGNAVSYRLRRITELLGATWTTRTSGLALHLACRARLLARAGPG
jgi:hypothetical protein